MNQITGALKAAGVSLPPLNYRIWHWLRDHQAKSYIEIASALNVDPHTITTAVSSMVKRGMLSYRNESNGKTKGSGPRSVRLYSTVYKEYEVLPVPLKKLSVQD